jgi:hypothetical protein
MKTSTKWNAESRQAFADRNILRAQQIPNKRKLANRQACRVKKWDF